MNLSKIPLLGMVTKQMDWLNQRQKVIAQNIANADTPEYIPHDLRALDFAELARHQSRRLKMAVSSAKHIEDPDVREQFRNEQGKEFTSEPSGNAVVLEEQMMLQSQTQVDYELMTRLYRKHVGMLRIAIGRNS